MKQTKPDTTGISKYWKKGEDDRAVLLKEMYGPTTDPSDKARVDQFLTALLNVVKRRKRTKFVGVGVFEWKQWKNRIPTGEYVETWRLTFKPGRYVKGKYHGSRR